MELTRVHRAILETVGEAGASPEKLRLSGREFGELERAELIVFWAVGSQRPSSIYGGGLMPGRMYLTAKGAQAAGLPPSLRLTQ
jgi:hypothetical protein